MASSAELKKIFDNGLFSAFLEGKFGGKRYPSYLPEDTDFTILLTEKEVPDVNEVSKAIHEFFEGLGYTVRTDGNNAITCGATISFDRPAGAVYCFATVIVTTHWPIEHKLSGLRVTCGVHHS